MSKRCDIFTEDFVIFLLNVGNTESVPEFEFEGF